MRKRIILVLGYICSGKSTYCSSYAQREGYKHLIVSDLVKKRLSATTRSQLTSLESAKLSSHIAIDVVDYLKEHDKVVVDGIRQWEIIEFIFQTFRLHEIEIRWLQVPKSELKRRFNARQGAKDDLTFKQAFDRDNELGLARCKKEISNLVQTVKNY